MENKWDGNIIGNSAAPYENGLIKNYSFAYNYYAIDLSGLKNYLALFDGIDQINNYSTWCSPNQCNYTGQNFFELMQNRGLTWRGYAESMPSNCYPYEYPYTGNNGSVGEYWPIHTSIPYFTDIAKYCSMNDLPLGNITAQRGNFYNDLHSNNNFANFSMITPNVCDDMHSCPINTSDVWLSKLVPTIIQSCYFYNTVTFISFDNFPDNLSAPIPMFVIGPPTLVNYGTFNETYNHYSTLATMENIFHLGNLGKNDTLATPMSAIIPSASPNGTPTTTTKTGSTISTLNSCPSSTTASDSQNNKSPSPLSFLLAIAVFVVLAAGIVASALFARKRQSAS